MLTSELIRRGAVQFPERTAVLCGDQRMTFAEVEILSNQIANALHDQLQPGAHIGLLYGNSLPGIAIDFACVKAGLNRVPLNPRLTEAEHEHMLAETEAAILIFGPDLEARAEALAQKLPELSLLCVGRSEMGAFDLLEMARTSSPQDPLLPVSSEDVILTVYTSGTTGRLKAAQHTQASWAAICANILANILEVRRDDVMLHAAPLIHASGTFVLPMWVRGAASAVLPGFDPEQYLAAIPRWGVTTANLVPTMLNALLNHPGVEDADVSSLRDIIYGASPMPVPVLERALELWGPRFSQYYGQTEAPLCISVLSKQDHTGPGAEQRLLSCGQPSIDCEVRLVDAQGEDVPGGEPGEIAVRAPFQMAGYYKAPELDREMRLPGGWLRTRDIGRFDEQGFLYLVDRTSDMIVSGGYNVYPREVEDALMAHPAVLECAVVGAPDEKWVEAVTAFVALRPGVAADEAELIEFARGRLAGYKTPKSVRFVDSVPKSAVGKLLRRALRDPLWEGRPRRV